MRSGGAVRLLQRGGLALLVVIVVLTDAADGVLELAQALAERLAGLWQPLGPQHDQRDRQDEDQFHGADAEGHCDPSGSPPDGGVEILDLVYWTSVEAGG